LTEKCSVDRRILVVNACIVKKLPPDKRLEQAFGLPQILILFYILMGKTFKRMHGGGCIYNSKVGRLEEKILVGD
jgi:hypothetical protein